MITNHCQVIGPGSSLRLHLQSQILVHFFQALPALFAIQSILVEPKVVSRISVLKSLPKAEPKDFSDGLANNESCCLRKSVNSYDDSERVFHWTEVGVRNFLSMSRGVSYFINEGHHFAQRVVGIGCKRETGRNVTWLVNRAAISVSQGLISKEGENPGRCSLFGISIERFNRSPPKNVSRLPVVKRIGFSVQLYSHSKWLVFVLQFSGRVL